MPSSAPMPFYAPKQGRSRVKSRFVSAGWVKPDKDRERYTESFGSTGGILVGIGEHVIQFAQLSCLGGFESFSSGGPFYIMTCPTGNEDGLFLFLVGRMSFVVEKKFAQSSSHTLWMNLIGFFTIKHKQMK